MDQLLRRQRLLVNGRLALGWSLESKDRAYRLAGFIGHLGIVGGIGLQIRERGAVIVAAHLLDGIDRPGQVFGVSAVAEFQVRACF